MTDERKAQDEPQDEAKDTQELSEEQLAEVAGGAVNPFISFFDKADGESIQK